MKLSDRKKKILSAVIDESIKSDKPVSSKDVQEKYISEFSSATIRNELMALEEMGYLFQPHTSAGRVPTAEGYKMYVEELMPDKRLTKKEAELLKENFDSKLFNLDEILQRAAKTISEATNYASVVSYGISEDATIENILLINLNHSLVLVVVATDLGIIKQETSALKASDDELRQASKILSSIFVGKTLRDMENGEHLITSELVRYKKIFDYIVKLITERDDLSRSTAVFGKDKLLSYPEYQDVNKLKGAMRLLSDEDDLLDIINSGDSDLEVSVKIGDKENDLADYSIVTTSLKTKGKNVGSLSVVGPMRMDYGKVVSILKNVTELIEKNIIGDEDDG